MTSFGFGSGGGFAAGLEWANMAAVADLESRWGTGGFVVRVVVVVVDGGAVAVGDVVTLVGGEMVADEDEEGACVARGCV